MHYHSNHMWCSESNWTGEIYCSRHMVGISEHYDTNDWGEMIYTTSVVDQRKLDALREAMPDKADSVWEMICGVDAPCLQKPVVAWLYDNVKDLSRETEDNGTLRAWAIGDVDYRSRDFMNLNIWFQRKADAMAFIRKWSEHKKPTTYCNYFKDDRRKLIDGKLVVVDQL